MKVDLNPFAPGNKALQYLEKRILDDNYRGDVSSQHNRWTFDDLVFVLSLLNRHQGSKNFLKIRTTDNRKRPKNEPAEFDYAKFCEEVKDKLNKGTQDAMRKNWFVDWHRAGWLDRFDKDHHAILPYSKASVHYVRVTSEGMKLLSRLTRNEKFFVFSKGLDKLYSGALAVLLDLFREYEIEHIDIQEYTFFVTGISTPGAFSLTRAEAVDLIKSWRTITPLTRKAIDKYLSEKLVKVAAAGNKTAQRDFHNWINKTQQTFSLLQQSVYFEYRSHVKFSHFSRLYFTGSALDPGQDFGQNPNKKLNRNQQQKHDYFRKHGVAKKKGFELHHVVALTWAESEHEFKQLDDWRNMVYIDAFSHAKITQTGNLHVIMVPTEEGFQLKNHQGDSIDFVEGQNVLIGQDLKNKMMEYNNELRGSRKNRLITVLASEHSNITIR